MTQTELTIRQPDDWHLHLRDGAMLQAVLPHTSANFARAIIMPNLVPPVVRTEHAQAYRERILNVLPAGHSFEPLMTLYLTEATDAADVRKGAESGLIKALKLYPSGATTNSENGVRDFEKIYPVLETMSDVDVPLLVHGEVTDADIDIFDREAVFLERVLSPIREKFPELRIVLEHATTSHAIDFVKAAKVRTAATITTHHLIINRNAILAGGIKPHYYCLPVAKREKHRLALREAATSGDPRFFLGTDSAPHTDTAKESACGCAGSYTAHAAIELYAEAFEAAGALAKLEGFASFHGPDFYGLPRNTDSITLVREEWTVPASLPLGENSVVPLRAGETLRWKLLEGQA